jgi:hypothetical protein
MGVEKVHAEQPVTVHAPHNKICTSKVSNDKSV